MHSRWQVIGDGQSLLISSFSVSKNLKTAIFLLTLELSVMLTQHLTQAVQRNPCGQSQLGVIARRATLCRWIVGLSPCTTSLDLSFHRTVNSISLILLDSSDNVNTRVLSSESRTWEVPLSPCWTGWIDGAGLTLFRSHCPKIYASVLRTFEGTGFSPAMQSCIPTSICDTCLSTCLSLQVCMTQKWGAKDL